MPDEFTANQRLFNGRGARLEDYRQTVTKLEARVAELEAEVNRQHVGWTACYQILKDAATAANCYHQALETIHGIEGLGIRAQTIIDKALKSCEGRDA